MSVWKGNNMIAATVPGPAGQNGTNGTNGQGIMIVPNFAELHNNINSNGQIEMTNFAEGCTWCSVGGYDNLIGGGGQGELVFGYGNRVTGGQAGIVTGYENHVATIGQGGCVEGYQNGLNDAAQGVHIEGYENLIKYPDMGVHVEGYKHNFSDTSSGQTSLSLTPGGHLGGYGLSNINSNFIKSHVRGGREESFIEAIGVKTGPDTGTLGRLVRNDGCMGIEGDLTFNAVDSDGHDIGRYTLGEIVEALIQAQILPDPNAPNL